MFRIEGYAEFSECDMSLGEQLENNLINSGFAVKKDYILQTPARLILHFGVENKDEHKPDTEFSMN